MQSSLQPKQLVSIFFSFLGIIFYCLTMVQIEPRRGFGTVQSFPFSDLITPDVQSMNIADGTFIRSIDQRLFVIPSQSYLTFGRSIDSKTAQIQWIVRAAVRYSSHLTTLLKLSRLAVNI
jgi:hypothetical protein